MPSHSSSVACAIKKGGQILRNELEGQHGFPQSSVSPIVAPLPLLPRWRDGWTLWRFDCRDFPKHCTAKNCAFCAEVNKLRATSKNIVDERQCHWDSYLKRDKCFDNGHSLLKVTADKFLPSKLAKGVFFNRKLGVAVFRPGITPKYESVENLSGGIFQLQLLATSGRKSVATVKKFDLLFTQTLRLLFALPAPIGCHVHGVFYRCELNPGKRRQKPGEQPLCYGNLFDLPFMAKLEVWIDDVAQKHLMEQSLINQMKRLIELMAIPIISFRFNRNKVRAEKLARNVKA